MAEHMHNVEFQVQRVSCFTQHVHSADSNRAQEECVKESGDETLQLLSLMVKHLQLRIRSPNARY